QPKHSSSGCGITTIRRWPSRVIASKCRCPDDNEPVPRPRQPARTRREVSAGGVVFRRMPDGPQFALIKANGRWSFPKGNIEKDDQFEELEGDTRRRDLSRRRAAGGLLSGLLFLHGGLFRAGLFITVIIGVWGLVLYFRKAPSSGGFRSTLVLTEALFIVQGL